MSDDVGGGAAARGDPGRVAVRTGAMPRAERPRAMPVEAAEPAGTRPTRVTIETARPVDAVALGEARDRIAAVLSGAEGQSEGLAASLDRLAGGLSIPLAPGADARAVADAQALAGLIAANARPAIDAQARLDPRAVRLMLDD